MSSPSAQAGRPAEPKIERSLVLHLRGDWGAANLHRVCGWIAQELADRCGPHTRIATWNSRGFSDAVRAVGRGEVQVALTTPTAFTVAALEGAVSTRTSSTRICAPSVSYRNATVSWWACTRISV